MKNAIDKLNKLDSSLYALGYSEALIHWDSATIAPDNSVEGRAAVLVQLSECYYNTLINDEVRETLDELEGMKDQLDEVTLGKLNFYKDEYEATACIPVDEYSAFQGLRAKSSKAWEDAKAKSDFSIFEPYLQKVIDFQRKYIGYRNKEGHPYNTLLHDYERGLTVDVADQFFKGLRETIVPLVKKISDKEREFTSPFTGVLYLQRDRKLSPIPYWIS